MKYFVRTKDQTECKQGDNDLSDRSDKKGANTLLAEIAEAGSQTDSRKGKQKSPARKVSDGQKLRLGEKADGG
jgi:hypothetical protein